MAEFKCENIRYHKVYEAFPDSTNYTPDNIPKELDDKRNFNWRPKYIGKNGEFIGSTNIDTIVIGAVEMSFEDAYKMFSAYRGVSVHFLIDNSVYEIPATIDNERAEGIEETEGVECIDTKYTVKIAQLVDPSLKAWYAGVSPRNGNNVYDSNKPCDDDGVCYTKPSKSLNDNAIGIWLIKPKTGEYTDVQLQVTADLSKCLMSTYSIPSHNMVSFTEFRMVSSKKDGKGLYNIDEEWQMPHLTYPMKELAELGVGAYPVIPKDLQEEDIVTYSDTSLSVQCVQSLFYKWGYIFDYKTYISGNHTNALNGYFGKETYHMLKEFIKHYDTDRYLDSLNENQKTYHRFNTHDQYKLSKLLKIKFGSEKIKIANCTITDTSIPPIDVTTHTDREISSCFVQEVGVELLDICYHMVGEQFQIDEL